MMAQLDEALHEGDMPTHTLPSTHQLFCCNNKHAELDGHVAPARESSPMFEKSLLSALLSQPLLDCILESAFGGDPVAHVALRLLQTLAFCPALFSKLGLYLNVPTFVSRYKNNVNK